MVKTPIRTGITDQSQIGKTTIEWTYLVETTALSDGSAAVKAALYDAAMAAITAGYILSENTATVKPTNPLWYEGKVRFEIPPWPDDEPNPLLRAATLDGTYDEFEKPYYIDTLGSPAATLADEVFDPLPTRGDGKLVLQLTKNFANFPAVTYDAIKYTTNAVSVTIAGTVYAPNTLLLKPVTVRETTEQVNGIKYHYFATTFRLATDHNSHLDTFQNRGNQELDSGGKPILIFKDKQQRTNWPLDENGHAMANASDAPFEFDLTPYYSVNWGIDFS